MRAIFIIGTKHNAYQIRPKDGPQTGADAFKEYVLQQARAHAALTVAEEMSNEALLGRRTVGSEIAEQEGLVHLLCDPNCTERTALGISRDDTESDREKREAEWLRRLEGPSNDPVLFVCGADHVDSFGQRCRDEGWKPTIVNPAFEADIPLKERIF